MTIVTISAEHPFLPCIAQKWYQGSHSDEGDRSRLILVPSRRVTQGLVNAFLQHLDGRAALLPHILAIGDLSVDDLPLPEIDTLSLYPAVETEQRLSVLSALILRREQAFQKKISLAQAWALARALAELMDDAERFGIDLRKKLPDAADGEFAEHWNETLRFLQIITEIWPQWLEENHLINPVARHVALLRVLGEKWRTAPPRERVWAVGFTDDFMGLGEVLSAVACAPNGVVALSGVDLTMPEHIWDALTESHPQSGFRRLLTALKASRDTLTQWSSAATSIALAGRRVIFEKALLPAEGVGSWGEKISHICCDGLTKIEVPHQRQEAVAIAMILRSAIEIPGKNAALITPDRNLARRVATELLRFGVVADDSAGESLAGTPSAVFLRLLAQFAAQGVTRVNLLAILKHPYAALSFTPGMCRQITRWLERNALRSTVPMRNLDEFTAHCLRTVSRHDEGPLRENIVKFLNRLEVCLSPLMRLQGASLPELLTVLLRAAEEIASSDVAHGAEFLWAGRQGHMLAQHMTSLLTYTACLPPQNVCELPSFLLASFEGKMVLGQRVLQGREGVEVHPRITILGLLEARRQNFDVVVLGGLNEGTWPPDADPGPWLSRPMRSKIGLPSPERAIGNAAHDFVALAMSSPHVVLSRAFRQDGAPTVPSRWLVRIDAFLLGMGKRLCMHPSVEWQRELDRPVGPPTPAVRPAPRPPLKSRPRHLSVTDIETWLDDPYAIYARRILKLAILPALDEVTDALDVGSFMHEGIAHWITLGGQDAHTLQGALCQALEARNLRPALAAWWRHRITRIADWISRREAEQRHISTRRAEIEGSWQFDAPGGRFRLFARADRIDIDAQNVASLYDYKTGIVPSKTRVVAGWNPQLPLEALILRNGGFKDLPAAETRELIYWKLSGREVPGEALIVADTKEKAESIVDAVQERLMQRVARFDEEATPYSPRPFAKTARWGHEYAALARFDEWGLFDEGSEDA